MRKGEIPETEEPHELKELTSKSGEGTARESGATDSTEAGSIPGELSKQRETALLNSPAGMQPKVGQA